MNRISKIFTVMFEKVIRLGIAAPIAAYKSKAVRAQIWERLGKVGEAGLKVAGVIEVIDLLAAAYGSTSVKERSEDERVAIARSIGADPNASVASLTSEQVNALFERFISEGNYGAMTAFINAYKEAISQVDTSPVEDATDTVAPQRRQAPAQTGDLRETMRNLRVVSEILGVPNRNIGRLIAAISALTQTSQGQIETVVELVEMGDRA
jgi:hypothetical protein